MTNHRSLAEVRTRLEKAVAALPGLPTTAEEVWERYLELSISILDSENDDYPPNLLQQYLECLLLERRLLLGLDPLPTTPEE
jgi:hypothetical protein